MKESWHRNITVRYSNWLQFDGRAAREFVKRSAVGSWERGEAGDALALISAQNAIRLSELLPLRHRRMATSAWDYRGPRSIGRGGYRSSLQILREAVRVFARCPGKADEDRDTSSQL